LTEFILNDKAIAVDLPPGMVLLDFIRYHKRLTGTKIGCREGDCGACVVLVGELKNNKLQYSSATSCLMPLGNANKKHIVTIEGINFKDQLNPIQQAMADEGATQCGFCTPGFIMSLAGFCLNDTDPKNVIASIDGNICRCTGYKSIERAASRIEQLMEARKMVPAVDFVTEKKILPSYFTGIKEKIESLHSTSLAQENPVNGVQLLGGGTDLYVQKHDEIKDADVHFLFDQTKLKGIIKQGNQCVIGASATVTDLQQSQVMKQHFPALEDHIKLISSTPIRNMATIAGNFVNASPIGDLSIYFLALNAQLTVTDGKRARELALRKFYKGYKMIDMKPGEYVESISFELPDKQTHFHFEKVSKRTNLDIASVNTAIRIQKDKRIIFNAGISAGGVAPVPLFLEKSSAFLKGKIISEEIIFKLLEIIQTEISPISDARGSADYKRLLLTQLVKAHFIKLFPELEIERIVFGE
jgi:xanthine dehydrogenase small subunit